LRTRSRFRNAAEYAAAAAVLKTLELSPRPLAEWLARSCLRIVDIALPRLRRTAARNLEMALPELSAAERAHVTDGVFRSLARVLVAFAKFPRIGPGNVHQWIRYEGFEHFQAAKARGRGVLIATGHLGNWELSAFAHALMAEPMNVVVRPLDNPLVDRLVETRRALSGNRIIYKKDFLRGILAALGRNEAVGILIDQNSTPEYGVFVEFFCMQACSNAGFARVAAHSGAAVIPGFALWSEAERRFVLRFYPPVEMSGDVQADTARLQHQLEEVIRRHPDQWLWIHRRWKTRPPGEAGFY
jgi:KDO2-lipid IV(A) lauroyltransferase